MDEVTVFLSLLFQGHRVGEITVHIRPMYDEAFPCDMACDVFVEDDTGKRFAASDENAKELLARIKDELPHEVWREIKETAEANYLEGATPAFSTDPLDSYEPDMVYPR